MREAYGGARSDNKRVKKTDSCLALRGNPARVARPGSRQKLGLKAKFLSQHTLHLFSKVVRRRNGDDNLAFPPRRFDGFVPIDRPRRLRFTSDHWSAVEESQ